MAGVLSKLLRRWYYRIRLALSRPHLVNIKGQGAYEGGWIDRDYAMFLACFKLLDDFVSEEIDDPRFVIVDWNADEHHRKAIREIRSLHFWWKYQRDLELAEVGLLFRNTYSYIDFSNHNHFVLDGRAKQHPDYCDYQNYDEWIQERDQKQLLRLMAIRRFLWT